LSYGTKQVAHRRPKIRHKDVAQPPLPSTKATKKGAASLPPLSHSAEAKVKSISCCQRDRKSCCLSFCSSCRQCLLPLPSSNSRWKQTCCKKRPLRPWKPKRPWSNSLKWTSTCRKKRPWRPSKQKLRQTCCSTSQQTWTCRKTPFQSQNKQACWRLWRTFAPSWPSCRQELQWIGQTPSKRRWRMLRGRGTFS